LPASVRFNFVSRNPAKFSRPPPTDTQRADLTKRQGKSSDLVVILPIRDWTCAECGAGGGDFLIMDDAGPLCLTCADMGHLAFVPAGDAALTRRARQASSLSAVVVRWSRSRRRYERQGVLAEEAALQHAEEQCLADEEAGCAAGNGTGSGEPAKT
jgi:hypothetical protein